MALTGEAAIADALFWKLSQLAFSPVLPVSLPNLPFTPPVGAYLEVSFQPNGSMFAPLGYGEPSGRQGIFQVSVMSPAGKRATDAIQIAVDIKAHFERGTDWSRNNLLLRIEREPTIAAGLQTDQGRFMIPVTVPWTVRAI